MSRVQEIAAQLESFSPEELRELRALLDEYEDRSWDQQFETQAATGEWEQLAEKALGDHPEGK